MSIQPEAALESQLIEKLSQKGYRQVTIKDSHDLETNFRLQLETHNHTSFTDNEFTKIMNHLAGGSFFEKAKKLRDKFELHRDPDIKYLEFINMKDWCRNIFQVTHQVNNYDGRYHNRYDVTILINGLPLVQIELKRRGLEIKEAFNQVARYKKESLQEGLFNYIQLFIISNGVNTRFFANNKSMKKEQLFYWTDFDNNRVSRLDDFAEVFLEPCHLSRMITKYMVLHHTDKVSMVLRPYQYYAAEKILKRVESTVNNGYIWHTTGSGKTLTSFKTSQLLTECDKVDKVIFVVDRKDLDYQTTREFNNYYEDSVTGTENTYSLVKQLASEHKLVITTIQKLTNAVKKDKHSKAMANVKDKRVIFIFDECHRSQFGDMHKLITGFFTRHQCFGFTGTPIMAVNANNGRTTEDLFGERLHRYVIKDAIDDGSVLGFSVEYFETFREKNIIRDFMVEDIDRREVFEAPQRLEKIVDHILAVHDRKTFNREFSALFAVSSIEVLIKYYDIFKAKKTDLSIAAIFTFGVNEDPEEERSASSRDRLEEFMTDYNQRFDTNFSTRGDRFGFGGNGNDFNAYYIDVARRVKEKKIDLLLVVSMFLTGFDSPLLNTLYVDKNLRYHGLVQAFSRTNRVCGDKKKYGHIVCFRDLKESTDEAIRLYSDKDAVGSILKGPYADHLAEFNQLAALLLSKYKDLESIDRLEGDLAKRDFILLFRDILRLKTQLETFSEFKVDDLEIDAQELADYTGKYRDLYDELRRSGGAQKTSILEDLDFEIQLLYRVNIDVDYILNLLKDLDHTGVSFEKDRKYILDLLDNSVELRSKKELIEKFMQQCRFDGGDIVGDFEVFIAGEKEKELARLAREEFLDPAKIRLVLEDRAFTGKIDDSLLESSFLDDNLGLLARIEKRNAVLVRLQEFIDKYSF